MVRIITGDECGCIKEVIPSLAKSKKKDINTSNPLQKAPIIADGPAIHRITPKCTRLTRTNGVVALCWTDDKQEDSYYPRDFASLHYNGTIQLWKSRDYDNDAKLSTANYRSTQTVPSIFSETDESDTDTTSTAVDPLQKPLHLSSLSAAAGHKSLLCAGNAAGRVVLLNAPDADEDWTLDAFSVVNSAATQAGYIQKNDHRVYPALTTITSDGSGLLAAGGKDREIALWNLETQQLQWKAKNILRDAQTLLHAQVWPTCSTFVGNLLAVGTNYNEVRLYDWRLKDGVAQRRPLCYRNAGLVTKNPEQHAVTALCPVQDNGLAVADSIGTVQLWDWRSMLRASSSGSSVPPRLVGPGGSVRGMAYAQQHLSVTSLDRMVHLYRVSNSTRQQEPVATFYLKQRLNCVLMQPSRDPVVCEEIEEAAAVENQKNLNTEEIQEILDEMHDEIHEYEDSSADEEGDNDLTDNDNDSEGDSGDGDESEEDEPLTKRRKR